MQAQKKADEMLDYHIGYEDLFTKQEIYEQNYKSSRSLGRKKKSGLISDMYTKAPVNNNKQKNKGLISDQFTTREEKQQKKGLISEKYTNN